MIMMEASPLALPVGERGLRFGNLRKPKAFSRFVNGRSETGVVGGGDRKLGELGEASRDEIEDGYAESLGGNGGGFECELNLKPLKRESDVDILVVAVQPALIRPAITRFQG
jgi:hypothetical protein